MPAGTSSLSVLALEPYNALSHRVFLEGYRRHSRHRVEAWTLPARKWKWRMRGSAYLFADRAWEAPASARPDVVLASDFMNLCDWRALGPPAFGGAPSVLYFHENQICYPLGAQAPADFHYGWINLSSALAADRVLFNSSYHRQAFLGEVERVLRRMPDHVPEGLAARIRARSEVLPVGIDFEPHRRALARMPRRRNETPVIVWNHRWEYDKDPELLVEALLALKRRGVPFKAVICGQAFGQVPSALRTAATELKDEIIHLGFFEDVALYLDALRQADVVLSTARQEFFGVSVVEAAFMGCLPVLPGALSYPEIIPAALHEAFLYPEAAALPEFLAGFLARLPVEHRQALQDAAARFDWRALAPELDRIVEETAAAPRVDPYPAAFPR